VPGPTDPGGEEIGYTPPAETTVDDGLVFPLTAANGIRRNQWHGIASTLNPANIAAYNSIIATAVIDAINQAKATVFINVPSLEGGTITSGSITVPVSNAADIQNAVDQAVDKALAQGTSLWYELVLNPVTNGPFGGAYVVPTSKLRIPQNIDLEAPELLP
jgi:hypothetical protein